MNTKNWLRHRCLQQYQNYYVPVFLNTLHTNNITAEFENVFGSCDEHIAALMYSPGFYSLILGLKTLKSLT